MKLVIGGYAQGKLDYVLQQNKMKEILVCDATFPEKAVKDKVVIIYHFHLWVKDMLTKGGCPEEEVEQMVSIHPQCIIISDEIGNGIVPMDAFEREYRERTGRILVTLAAQAQEVERVICGIGQKIK